MSKSNELFSDVFCFCSALSYVYSNMHWKTSGSNYYGDHLLYQRLYDDVSGEIDGIAEKFIGVISSEDFLPVKNAQKICDFVKEYVKDDSKSDEFPKMAISMELDFMDMVDDLLFELDQEDRLTGGIEDTFQPILNKHEEHMYLLKQRIGK